MTITKQTKQYERRLLKIVGIAVYTDKGGVDIDNYISVSVSEHSAAKYKNKRLLSNLLPLYTSILNYRSNINETTSHIQEYWPINYHISSCSTSLAILTRLIDSRYTAILSNPGLFNPGLLLYELDCNCLRISCVMDSKPPNQ